MYTRIEVDEADMYTAEGVTGGGGVNDLDVVVTVDIKGDFILRLMRVAFWWTLYKSKT